MSESWAEAPRRGLRLWSEGDLEGSLATMRPDVEWHLYFALPDVPAGKRVYRGHDEVREIWDAFRSAWDEIVVQLEETLEVDEARRRVLSRAHFRARGGASGIEVDRPVFYLFEMDEEGLLARIRPFETEEEAREAFEAAA